MSSTINNYFSTNSIFNGPDGCLPEQRCRKIAIISIIALGIVLLVATMVLFLSCSVTSSHIMLGTLTIITGLILIAIGSCLLNHKGMLYPKKEKMKKEMVDASTSPPVSLAIQEDIKKLKAQLAELHTKFNESQEKNKLLQELLLDIEKNPLTPFDKPMEQRVLAATQKNHPQDPTDSDAFITHLNSLIYRLSLANKVNENLQCQNRHLTSQLRIATTSSMPFLGQIKKALKK